MKSFDPDLLRTLVAFADSGSLGRAAANVGRTPSAVTAQMQRLEETVGVGLLEPSGRGRRLTEAGERLLGHARRILNANNEAWLSVTGAAAEGHVSVGVTQDFADTDLPALLSLFARSHPGLRIDLRVGRSSELADHLTGGHVDVVIAMRQPGSAGEIGVIIEPMCWLTARDGLAGRFDEVPLAVLDPPCGFRDAALRALEKSGRPYRLAAASTSLAGLRVAVRAGIALTARTARWKGPDIVVAPQTLRLPKLPKAEFSIRIHQQASNAALRLADILAEGLGAN